MSNPCKECLAIAQDLADAYRQIFSDQDLREAWLAARRMAGGTEDDVLRAEELFAKARAKGPSKIGAAMSRMYTHQVRTGHRLPNVFYRK